MNVTLALIGGPLDGVYLPVNPDVTSLPSQLYVYAPEAGAWSMYVAEGASKGACDVYSLKGRAVQTLTTVPRHTKQHKLLYVRPLNPAEVAALTKMSREHGI